MIKLKKIALSITMIILPLCFAFAQVSITTQSDVRGEKITGEWKDGSIVLTDGTVKDGQTKGFSHSGNSIKSVKFRQKKGSEVEVFKADDCDRVQWGGTYIVSLPKNMKKPEKGNKFFVAVYYGQNISVLFDPKANTASSGFNQGESLKVLVFKDDDITEVSKLKFKKQFSKLCGDSKKWKEKSSEKKWFKYNNLFEVASYYDESIKESLSK